MTNMSLRPYQSSNYSENNPGRTYIWYQDTPVYEFGFGLHYTNFTASFSSNQISPSFDIASLVATNSSAKFLDLTPFQSFDVNVKNTGSVASDYVVLGFLSGQFGPQPYPNKRLVSYTRLHGLAGSAVQTATLNLTLGSLARVDDAGDVVLYPGNYSMVIDTDAKAVFNFSLTGAPSMLDSWPAPPPFGNPGNDTVGKL